MKIIISPAKKMTSSSIIEAKGSSPFLKESKGIVSKLKSLSLEEVKILYGCSDRIALEAYHYIQSFSFVNHQTPALLSYDGIQYQYMSPNIFKQEEFDYLEDHLFILSALYGVLKPFDGVCKYRLEMNNCLKIGDHKDLYAFWKDKIYKETYKNEDTILNLASEEYAKSIRKYVNKDQRFIDVEFREEDGKEKGVYAKMCRGLMTRYCAVNKIENVEDIKKFKENNYQFVNGLSSDKKFIFKRNNTH